MFTQRISMDCSKEQYEKYLKEELLKMGYEETLMTGWYCCAGIVNNLCGDSGSLSNVQGSDFTQRGRTYLGKFNAPLFLALAAMTDRKYGGYGEWWVYRNGVNWDKQNANNLYANSDWRKATVSEIMAKFGDKESTHSGKLVWEISLDTIMEKTKIEQMIEQHREMWDAYKKPNEKIEEKTYEPKNGDYCAHTDEVGDTLVCIYKNKNGEGHNYHVGCKSWLSYRLDFNDWCIGEWVDRPATPEEIALLDSKLAEQGKFFNKETMQIEEVKKEPKGGDFCIFHDGNKICSVCRIFRRKRDDKYIDQFDTGWRFCIPFESAEQYRNFIKER